MGANGDTTSGRDSDMRLICPNCDAQYEVPTEVIPKDGRDVQCSNCGDTWFQTHPDQDDALGATPPAAEEVKADVSQHGEEFKDGQFAAVPSLDEDYEEDEPETIAPKPVARELDPAVVEVLQQEVEHEAQQRRNEQAASLEIQPDLGLQEAEDDAGRRAREARERMPQSVDATPDRSDAAVAEPHSSRRDLLPDVEEINSSLRSDSDRSVDGRSDVDIYLEEEAAKRSFGRGFTLIVLLAVILAGVYIMGPKIAQSVPAAEPAISKYVAFVDSGRAALDTRVKGILDWLDAKASNSSP